MKTHRSLLLSLLFSVVLVMSAPFSTPAADTGSTSEASIAEKAFRYEHDPMENPEAAKDIVVNPEAVYGYSPSPDSTRLKEYVDLLDWTNEEEVAAARKQRAGYFAENKKLYRMIEDMLGEAKSVEEIARAVSTQRNENRLASYEGNPEGLAKVKKSNLDTYGNENGPTPEFLYEKYGSWQVVIEKALSTNPGMDACLGFYDENYDMYDISDELSGAGFPVEEGASGGAGTVVVEEGDCLWSIAEEQLGDGNRWKEIYELNEDSIDDPSLIHPGQELILPAA